MENPPVTEFTAELAGAGDGPLARVRLDALEVGATAEVGAPASVDPTVLRLLEMGLTAGARVTMLRRAPWGDPLEVLVRGTRLCLRRKEASQFPVRVVGGTR